MKLGDFLRLTDHGLCCVPGDFFIDPRRAVETAVVTHAHADHASPGSRFYVAHPLTLALLRHRLSRAISGVGLPYGAETVHNGVRVSLHPAGHVAGSAQVRLEYRGFTAVITGDYKLERDGVSDPYEQQRCHLFVTESTFALPVYRWPPQKEAAGEILSWYRANSSRGITSILMAYALGKAQRLLSLLAPEVPEIVVHRSAAGINAALQAAGVPLPEFSVLNSERLEAGLQGGLVIASSQALREDWPLRVAPFSLGLVSGWMALRRLRSRRDADAGFVISDHADWPALNRAVEQSGAETVIVTHGYDAVFARWLRERGIRALEMERLGLAPGNDAGAENINEED